MVWIWVSGPSGIYDKAGYLKFLNFSSFLCERETETERDRQGEREDMNGYHAKLL